jgi:hypothetical protein
MQSQRAALNRPQRGLDEFPRSAWELGTARMNSRLPQKEFKKTENNTMLKEKPKTDYFIAIAAALLFVVLVVYLTMQDSSAIGPL